MKILVTGGLGFIGSNFITKLLREKKEFQIVNVDAELSGSNKENLHDISEGANYHFVKGNITNKHLMKELISDCDVVVNFAAESFVDKSIHEADPFLVSNIRGAFTILDIITKQNKKMIQVSTDEVFGSLSIGSADENYIFNPSNPYAATKASAELLINSYSKTYGSDVIITRCTNNYGPRQFPEKLIPKIILLAKENKKIPIYGKGENIRDWIFVDDHCDAILNVLLEGKSGESYNISSGNEINNLDIVKKILGILDRSEELIEYVEDRPGHDLRYSLESSKMKKQFNWSAKTSFEEGLKNTIERYERNSNRFSQHSSEILKSTPWKK